MLLKTIAGKIIYRIFTLLIAAMYSITAYVAPSTDEPVKPVDSENAKLVFAAVADPQVSNYILKRIPFFDAAAEDIKNSAYPLDAILMAGDIAENGLAIEYQYVYEKLSGIDTQYIIAEGNHDIRLRLYKQSLNRFSNFTNALNNNSEMTSFHYSKVVNGYKFIVLGSDRTEFEENYLSKEQLAWLENELAGENGKPTFVICHQPLKNTHGLPITWNSPFDSKGTVGKQSDKLKAILEKYSNAIFITGHLHTGFGEYTYEKLGKTEMINLPSLCINNDYGDYNNPGIGCIVEVYENEILFRARDFAKGKWLPEYDHTITLK